MTASIRLALCVLTAVACIAAGAMRSPIAADDSERILTLDHFVRAPAIPGAATGSTLYVRERVKAGLAARGGAGTRVAVFVHGAGTPAEVSFDVPFGDFSWMAYLAAGGFDVFSVDMTGYGRSTRIAAMSDPCNIPGNRQAEFVPALLAAPCTPTVTTQGTTIASDWNDVNAAVDYVRALRHVDQVNLVGWSLGGIRAGGYAAQHPEKVRRMVLLAPAYIRASATSAPSPAPAKGDPFSVQSRTDLVNLWDSQVGCAGQYEDATLNAIWSDMMASDPVGASWGPGVRRAPSVTTWGWNQAVVAKQQTPLLMVSGVHDVQVRQERVRELYADYGGAQKAFIDLGCSSHNAMREKNHVQLFKASLEWLDNATVDGKTSGEFRKGY